jgi:CxxC-x17-CxxC domain-containing protein
MSTDIPILPDNKDITYLGLTTFRDQNKLFGIKRKDRRQHVYILGKSGTGKSVLLSNMIIQNISNGDGVCVVDPHGELVEGILSAIPPERIKDVVYFNPADTDHYIGFNVLECQDPKYKHLVASGLMGIFTKIWSNVWSARMEYIMNNCILALLDTPNTTLLGIPRMLVDKDYRQQVIANLKDPVIKAFWVHEYEEWQEKYRSEAIAPIQNKVGQFLSTSIVRNVVGQAISTINIFDIMNQGKIFLVNVSKGRIGEDNSALLGGMIITKIQLAAMERVRIPEEERKDFYLYVDEFQNFVTDAFASILSEARKYRLNLTVAHQYTAQLVIDKSSAVRDAVFGNVGTSIIFRVGADDADFLEKEFEPEFTVQDIVNLPNYKIYLKLMIDGVTSRPFSAKTLSPIIKNLNKEIGEKVINSSRNLYCRSRGMVEQEINSWSGITVMGGGEVREKVLAACSLCKKETTLPFKPIPGKPVYCWDCMDKIKAGELKPLRGSSRQMESRQEELFQPLADLGIEFQSKSFSGREQDFPKARPFENKSPMVIQRGAPSPTSPAARSGLGGPSKDPKKVQAPNFALREILKKTLSKVLPYAQEVKPPVVPVAPAAKVQPISLSSLKPTSTSAPASTVSYGGQVGTVRKEKAASSQNMSELKNLISKNSVKMENVASSTSNTRILKIETVEEKKPETKVIEEKKIEEKKIENKIIEEKKEEESKKADDIVQKKKIKEVPEDILRKILE